MATESTRSEGLSFEPDDAILDEIARLARRHATLGDALAAGCALACALPDWSFARYRLIADGASLGPWTWHPEDAAPGAGHEAGAASAHQDVARLSDAFRIDLLRPDGLPLERRAYAAGLRTAARLTVFAEDRPAARLELFGFARVDGRIVRLLQARLDHVAARDRSRIAVQRAAAFVRRATAAQVSDPTPEHAKPHVALASGALLEDRIRMAIRRRRRGTGGHLAVLKIDPGVDGAAPEDLEATARRLLAGVRETDTVARDPEGGGFFVVAEDLVVIDDARQLAGRLMSAVRGPEAMSDSGSDARAACRIGVLVTGPRHHSPGSILSEVREATAAVESTGGIVVRAPEARVTREDRDLIESELRRAMGSRELFVEYQPIVALHDGRIAGLEAFMRWQHPRVGRIPPAEFLGVAEISPLLHELGDWILDQVARHIRGWSTHVAPSRVPPVDVNYTATQLLAPDNVDRMEGVLRRHELPGEAVRVDVNETDLMEAPEALTSVLERLARRGVASVIDDFGTGYSSLRVLHAMPVAGLKIDGTFLPRATSGVDAWVIARSIVELGKVLGLDVIAEGVETREQLRTLRQLGCPLGQGYAFGQPVSSARALDLIRDGYPLDLSAPAR